jgi:hypothetical protein
VASISPKPASAKRTLSLKRRPPIPPPPPVPLPVAPAPLDAEHFFTIWRYPDGIRPKQRHSTLASATAERERLIAANPGKEFRIFDCRQVPV